MRTHYRNHSILKLKGISIPEFFMAEKIGAQGSQQDLLRFPVSSVLVGLFFIETVKRSYKYIGHYGIWTWKQRAEFQREWKARVMGHGGGRGGSSVECEESGVVNSMSAPQTPNSFTYPLIAWPIMLLYFTRDFSSAYSAMATFFILFSEHRTLLLFVIPQLPMSLQVPSGWGWMRRYVYYQPSEKGVIWWDCRPDTDQDAPWGKTSMFSKENKSSNSA